MTKKFSELLQENCMLVKVSVSKWTGVRTDIRATKIVEDECKAQNSGRFYKYLMPRHVLSRINGTEVALRDYVNSVTVPWDGHQRILPADLVVDFMAKVRDFENTFNHEVERIVKKYDEILEQSKERLGELFDPNEYPSKEALKSSFGIRVTLLPFPAITNDFRIKVGDEVVEKIKKDLEQEFQKVQTEGKKVLIDKFLSLADSLVNGERLQMRSIDKLKSTIDIVLGYDNIYDLDGIRELLLDLKKVKVDESRESKEDFRDALRSTTHRIRMIMEDSVASQN